MPDTPPTAHPGFAIFQHFFFQGAIPACYGADNYPEVFASEMEAQREIADTQLTRIQEFLDGEREFEDAISTEEFVLAVDALPDGSVRTRDGRVFGKLE
jgi:hypothetical protein